MGPKLDKPIKLVSIDADLFNQMIEALEHSLEYIHDTFSDGGTIECPDPRPIPNYDEQLMLVGLKKTITKAMEIKWTIE